MSRGWCYLREVWLKCVHIRTAQTEDCLIRWWAIGISKSQRMMAGAEWRWSLRSRNSSLLIMRRNKPRWLTEVRTVYPETYISRSWSSEGQRVAYPASGWGMGAERNQLPPERAPWASSSGKSRVAVKDRKSKYIWRRDWEQRGTLQTTWGKANNPLRKALRSWESD